jgi:ribosome recycling factor
MAKYDKADLERRMKGAVDALRHDLRGFAPDAPRLCSMHHRRDLWLAHAAQPGGNRVGAEPRLLSVQVWDKSSIGPVEKAIRSAGLGLNPINDGNTLRLADPDLTEERRKELAKLASQYAEKARIAIRNVRRDGWKAEGRRSEEGNLGRRAQARRNRSPEADRRDHQGGR